MAGIERVARELPGGDAVAFVFTDIEGSNALFRAHELDQAVTAAT